MKTWWQAVLGALALASAVFSLQACREGPATTGSSRPAFVDTANAAATAPGTSGSSPSPAPAAETKLGTSAGVATTARAPDFEALPGARATFGMLGRSVYRIELPDRWNGDLVLWAYGYRGTSTEVAVESPPAALRRTLIQQGYAWAASSYSENGYTPGIGADDTLELKHFFARQVSKPARTYLIGVSMGGNVVTLSLEHFADEYDGALALCGALGGEEIIDYLVAWTRAAEFVAGPKLPASPTTAGAMTSVFAQWAGILGPPEAPTVKGRQFASVIRMTTGGPRPFFLEGYLDQYFVNFGLALTDPELKSLPARAATNDYLVYGIESGLGLTSEEVNAGVVRQHADPEARNGGTHPDAVPTSGRISDPLLTIHTTGDLFVPVSQEVSYRKKAEAAGRGDLLVQRLIRAGGHCRFSEQEIAGAWDDLRAWVTEKKKPAGDDVLGDLSDAGRQFTNQPRPGDPGGK